MATGPSDRYDSHRRLNQPAVDEKSRRWRDHCRARSPVTSVSNRLQDSIRLFCGSGSEARGRVLPVAAIGQYEAVLANSSLLATVFHGSQEAPPTSGRLAGSASRHSPSARRSIPQSSCCRRRIVMIGALRRWRGRRVRTAGSLLRRIINAC